MPTKNRLFPFLFVLVFLLPNKANSQNFTTVRGRAVNGDGRPVEGVTVLLFSLPDSSLVKTTSTESTGRFELDVAQPGSYTIVTSLLGETKYCQSVNISAGETLITLPDILVQSSIRGLKEVVISEKNRFIERKAGKTTLHINSSNILVGSNAFEILNRAPGVQIDKNDRLLMKGKPGVLVMIDGKVTHLAASELADLLRNTAHETIDRIDLITNASARYDAAGGGGVIDIRLKKGKNLGTNGSATFGAGYGDFHKVNSGITVNHRTSRVNFFGGYNFSNNKRPETLSLSRTIQSGNKKISLDVSNLDDKTRYAQNYNAGMDYSFSSKHTAGFLYTGQYQALQSDENNSTWISNNSLLDSNILMFSGERRQIASAGYNLNYKGQLTKKQELTVDLDYFTYTRDSRETLENRFLTSANTSYRPPRSYHNNSPSEISIRTARFAYLVAVTKRSSLETGFKGSSVKSMNNRIFENYTQNTWIKDNSKSNQFDFSESIYAGYLNFKSTLGSKSELEAGIRLEETRTRANSETTVQDVNRNYLDWFPSFTFSHQLNKSHKTAFSYSRRVNRPLYEDLNPFIYFLDQYNFREGNPYLRPEYSSTVELSHVYREKLSTTFSYTHVKDVFLTFQKQDDLTGVTVAGMRNLDSQTGVGVEISAELSITSWWNSSYTFQGNYLHFKYFKDGNTLDKESPYYTADVINTFNLRKNFAGEVLFNYESATNYGLFDFEPVYSLDLSLSKSLLKNRANVRLGITDIFNSRSNRYSALYQNLNMQAKEKVESRVGKISVNYRFGKTTVKAARKRTTGAEEESRRIKN